MSSPMPQPPGLQPAVSDLPPQKGGCMRAGLIGCGIVALLCVLVFVGGVLFVRKNPGMLLDFAVRGIEGNYGSDVTEQDKKELRAAVEDVKEAIRSNRMRDGRSLGFQRSFRMGSSSGKLSHEDVQDMIRGFREAAGKPGRPAGEPAPGPGPTMVPMTEPTRAP